jgi:hypothetical protein
VASRELLGRSIARREGGNGHAGLGKSGANLGMLGNDLSDAEIEQLAGCARRARVAACTIPAVWLDSSVRRAPSWKNCCSSSSRYSAGLARDR